MAWNVITKRGKQWHLLVRRQETKSVETLGGVAAVARATNGTFGMVVVVFIIVSSVPVFIYVVVLLVVTGQTIYHSLAAITFADERSVVPHHFYFAGRNNQSITWVRAALPPF